MPAPQFAKKKPPVFIDPGTKKGTPPEEEEEDVDEDESESDMEESADAPAPVKKGEKLNPLRRWADKFKK